MTGDVNFSRTATVIQHMMKNPSHGLGGIIDTLPNPYFRNKTVIDRHHNHATVLQLLWDFLVSSRQSTPMKPHDNRTIHRI